MNLTLGPNSILNLLWRFFLHKKISEILVMKKMQGFNRPDPLEVEFSRFGRSGEIRTSSTSHISAKSIISDFLFFILKVWFLSFYFLLIPNAIQDYQLIVEF